MKGKIFFFLTGLVVVGISAYIACRTYDAYVEKALENDLLLKNAEALATEEFVGCDKVRYAPQCCIYVGVNGAITLSSGIVIEAEADGYVRFDGMVDCLNGGSICCTRVDCDELYSMIAK